MIPPQQFTGQGQSPPDASRVLPAPCGNSPVSRPTSSGSTPPVQLSGFPGRLPLNLPTKQFQLATELLRTDVAGIADFLRLQVHSHDK